VFIALALTALVHAIRCGREHFMIWLAALVAGTANDFIFMALPLVDNFWQAEGLIMVHPRMPLYIPCVYICFMYIPTVALRRTGLSRWRLAAATGLAAALFYAPYDIVGAKYLWWVWHDTDQPIAARLLGAPCSSSLWVLTFVGSFSWLVDQTLRGRDAISNARFAGGLAKVAGLTTLMMMIQMTALQQIDGGCPGYGALAGGVIIYLVCTFSKGVPKAGTSQQLDRVLAAGVVIYALSLVTVGALFDPAAAVSEGLHQEVGECGVEQTDITGFSRFQFLCLEDFDEEFTFDCTEEPEQGATWYTVCGTPHASFGKWMGGMTALCLAVASLFGFLLGRKRADR
jgi:hypothetical protein